VFDENSQTPLDRARRLAAAPRQRRFYQAAEMRPEGGSFALHLDGKRALTPGRRPLSVPDPAVAEVIAGEWAGQGETIDPASMPVTRLANTAIDGVAERLEAVREDVLAYVGTDLLYYRAGEPEGLVNRQRELWDPVLAWAEARFNARFMLAEGVMHVPQPEPTLAAFRAELARYDEPLALAGLHLATSLSGSALLALALASGALGVEDAWAAAHVDEDWNISQWGDDAEAAERRARRFRDFEAAALALASAPR